MWDAVAVVGCYFLAKLQVQDVCDCGVICNQEPLLLHASM